MLVGGTGLVSYDGSEEEVAIRRFSCVIDDSDSSEDKDLDGNAILGGCVRLGQLS